MYYNSVEQTRCCIGCWSMIRAPWPATTCIESAVCLPPRARQLDARILSRWSAAICCHARPCAGDERQGAQAGRPRFTKQNSRQLLGLPLGCLGKTCSAGFLSKIVDLPGMHAKGVLGRARIRLRPRLQPPRRGTSGRQRPLGSCLRLQDLFQPFILGGRQHHVAFI